MLTAENALGNGCLRSSHALRLTAICFLASCGGTGGMFGGERETDLWKVDIDAAAGGDGRTWGTAFRHPQDAVDAARWGDEIWIAEGTYTRRSPSDTVLLAMKEGVSVYGGFAGDESLRDERDWAAHLTMLDGETLVYNVVVGASDGSLDGFTITGAYAEGGLPDNYGGGMMNDGVAGLTVADCTFSGNESEYGGGMSNRDSSLAVTNCTFSGNTGYDGGGMYSEGSSPTVTNCTFSGNWSYFGGGMCNYDSHPTVTNCTFSGNTAPNNGGGMYNERSSPTVTDCTFSGNAVSQYGGGMYSRESSPSVTNCTFSDNTAGAYGGGMCNLYSSPTVTDCTFSGNTGDVGGGCGGGMYNSLSNPVITNCTFADNLAPDGGGMCNGGGAPTVTNCTFSGNTTYLLGNGGGMYNYASSLPTVTDCTFSGNSAGDGGGMYNYASSLPTVINCTFSGNSADAGGGMYNYYSSPAVTNCTFSGNSAYYSGGGMRNHDSSSPTVTNCILWGDSAPTGPEVYNGSTGSPVIGYSDVQGCGGSGAGWDSTFGADGGDNIDSDPLFVNVPLRTDLTSDVGTTDTVEITDAGINCAVGDVIELNDDGVVRTVSDVTGTTVTFSPALPSASTAAMLVQNWGPGATNLDVDLHLSSGSPCIDAGTDVGAPDHDLDGNPRPSGSYYDMGAYECW